MEVKIFDQKYEMKQPSSSADSLFSVFLINGEAIAFTPHLDQRYRFNTFLTNYIEIIAPFTTSSNHFSKKKNEIYLLLAEAVGIDSLKYHCIGSLTSY